MTLQSHFPLLGKAGICLSSTREPSYVCCTECALPSLCSEYTVDHCGITGPLDRMLLPPVGLRTEMTVEQATHPFTDPSLDSLLYW